MKYLVCLLFLFVAIQSFSQYQRASTVIIASPEFDTRPSFALKAGFSNVFTEKGCEKYCFKAIYHQVFAKYNPSQQSLGGQTAFGYCNNLLGARFGVDYEYSTITKKSECMLFLVGGFDLYGGASIVLGPKLN